MPHLRTHCLLCCEIISAQPLSFKTQTQVKLLTKWKEECVSSFCQTLQLNPMYLQKTGFCLKCQQLVRDMDFAVRSIERFQKRLRALKNRTKAILTINVKELAEETHVYARTVQKILAVLNANASESQSVTSSESTLTETYNLGSCHNTDSCLESAADTKIDNDNMFHAETDSQEINERPKRPRKKSRFYSEDESEYNMEEMEIKDEVDDETEIFENYDNDHDPDFNITDEYEHPIDPAAMETGTGVIKADPSRTRKIQKKIKMKKPRQTYACPHCERIYQSNQYLTLHVSEVHNAPPVEHQCSTCKKSFDSPEKVQEHMELHTVIRSSDRPFSCVICKLHCTGIRELQAHVFKDHEENSFKCPNEGCEKAYLTKSKLYFHIRANHNPNDRSHLVCPECSYQARAPSVLKKHMFKHGPKTERPSVTCDVEGCGKVFCFQFTLNRHKKIEHDKDDSVLFKCTLCPKVFKDSSGLTFHQAHHSNIRPFLCEHCSVSFKTIKNLKTHYKVHEKSAEGRRPQSVLSKPRKGRLPLVLNSEVPFSRD